jgi:hypothetical protein
MIVYMCLIAIFLDMPDEVLKMLKRSKLFNEKFKNEIIS